MRVIWDTEVVRVVMEGMEDMGIEMVGVGYRSTIGQLHQGNVFNTARD